MINQTKPLKTGLNSFYMFKQHGFDEALRVPTIYVFILLSDTFVIFFVFAFDVNPIEAFRCV